MRRYGAVRRPTIWECFPCGAEANKRDTGTTTCRIGPGPVWCAWSAMTAATSVSRLVTNLSRLVGQDSLAVDSLSWLIAQSA